MDLSVVICTRNRAVELERTLRGLAACVVPGGTAWELIVVDNGSTDATEHVVSDSAASLPVVHVQEPRAGKDHALNRAIRAARAENIVFLDDDVDVDANLLKAYLDAFTQLPDVNFFGGRIRLALPSSAEAVWLTLPQTRLVLAQSDFGDVQRPLTWPECPAGPNMALRRRAMGSLAFSPVSRQVDSLPLEDSLLFKRALEAGEQVIYLPSAVVDHRVRPDQLTLDYFCRRYGQSLVGQWLLDGGMRHSGRAVPLFLLRKLVSDALLAAINVAASRETRLTCYITFRGTLALASYLLRNPAEAT